MNKHKYALRYKYELEDRDEGFDVADATDGRGLTDCLLGISILLPETGEYSQAIVISAYGKEKRPLTQKEIFKVWLMLGISLHDVGKLEGWQSEFVKMHSEMIRTMFSHKDTCETLKVKKK